MELCAKLGYDLADSVPLPKHENLSKAHCWDAEGSLGKNQRSLQRKTPRTAITSRKLSLNKLLLVHAEALAPARKGEMCLVAGNGHNLLNLAGTIGARDPRGHRDEAACPRAELGHLWPLVHAAQPGSALSC